VLAIQQDGFFHQSDPKFFSKEADQVLATVKIRPDGNFDPFHVFKAVLFYETRKHEKEIPCEQTPRSLLYMGEILNAFPEAHIIYMVRDPRDVLLSQKNKWRRRFLGGSSVPLREAIRSWANYHPYTIAKMWQGAERTVKTHDNNLRLIQVKFEDFLLMPESQLNKICDFLGLDFKLEMLNVTFTGSSLKYDEPNCVGIDPTRAGNWRQGGLTAEEIYICQKTTRKEMLSRGYSVVKVNPSLLKLAYLWIIWPVKITLAIILNLGRTRNMLDSIRRRI
jgi:hypothetical protein